ncbi:glycosyl transferase family 90 protein [Nitzschia inconspicua]|uniref:Glycosyl transferase family 90 protein n=1 Tax=Nitzschia inconspicua TaxID=303405 RepID=A0A9K3PZK1_9STRA|nr:glycosyl transferase family 90 protein [Nitzschia inconspicua]
MPDTDTVYRKRRLDQQQQHRIRNGTDGSRLVLAVEDGVTEKSHRLFDEEKWREKGNGTRNLRETYWPTILVRCAGRLRIFLSSHRIMTTRLVWKLLIIITVSSFISTSIVLYGIYRRETLPSPFLSSPYNYLPYHIRGVAPPSHRFSFPTPSQRIQFYMGDWYFSGPNGNNPHLQYLNSSVLCDSSTLQFWKSGMPEIGKPYRFNEHNLHALIYHDAWKRLPWRPQRSHPGDAYLHHFQLLVQQAPSSPRNTDISSNKQMLLQFGDGKDSANFLSTPYPIMVKTRLSHWVYQERYGSEERQSIPVNNPRQKQLKQQQQQQGQLNKQLLPHHPPILGMYEIHRHYHDHFYETDDLWEQRPWHTKHNSIVWRGSTSGQRRPVIQTYIDAPRNDIDIAFSEILTVHKGKFPKPDQYYLRNAMSIKELLSYKYLLVLEGWGMASSLKWMLYSNSVVFMAPPTKTSWAMEELLVPYIHYVPLWQNHSNLPQQLEWARTHDEDCRKMALYSRHYMERLVTSPQAQQETLEILAGIDRIYQEQYGSLLQECPIDDK